jgi:predicted  nucleic acid-binding Zn-ribbon protein
MIKDLEWLIKLQKVDSKVYESTREMRKSEARIGRLNFEIEETTLFIIKEEREKESLEQEKLETMTGIEDQERLLIQKKEDLQNDKKTKKEHIKREVLKLEQAVKIFSEKVIDFESRIKEIEESINSKNSKITDLRKILEEEENRVDKLLGENKKIQTSIETDRDEIKKNVRLPFLNHYERIIKIRNGVAVSFVTEQGLCNGCKIHIPVTYRQKIMQMSDYNICEGCGRILVTSESLE